MVKEQDLRGLRKFEWLFPMRGKWLLYFLVGMLVSGLLIAAWDLWLGTIVRAIVELGGLDG
jgi:hypothetical protein